jgi:hypothetical protein
MTSPTSANSKSGLTLIQIAEVPIPATRPRNSPGHFAGVDTQAIPCYNTHLHTEEQTMTFTEAMTYIKQVQENLNEPLLETLMYMQDNEFMYDEIELQALDVVIGDFRKLLATA